MKFKLVSFAVLSTFHLISLVASEHDRSEVEFHLRKYMIRMEVAHDPNLPTSAQREALKKAEHFAATIVKTERYLEHLLWLIDNGEDQYAVSRFLLDQKIKTPVVLEKMRDIIINHDRKKFINGRLGGAISYMAVYGDESDIERLDQVRNHSNPALINAHEFAVKSIQSRVKARNSVRHKGTDRGKLTTMQIQEVSKNQKLHTMWYFVIFLLIGALLLVLICWKYRKNRSP